MARYNPNRAKINRSYTFEELAEVFGVHKNTVSAWVKNGLPCLHDKRPYLILGASARDYLQKQRLKDKRKCGQDELYCVKCREPSKPAENFVEYQPCGAGKGRITGLCSACGGIVNKFVSSEVLASYAAVFDLALPKGMEHIRDRGKPLVNSDFHQ